MSYTVSIVPSAQREMRRLPRSILVRIHRRIINLGQDPRPSRAKKLRADSGYRIRIGDYRLVYDIDDASQTVTIRIVRHRRDAYR